MKQKFLVAVACLATVAAVVVACSKGVSLPTEVSKPEATPDTVLQNQHPTPVAALPAPPEVDGGSVIHIDGLTVTYKNEGPVKINGHVAWYGFTDWQDQDRLDYLAAPIGPGETKTFSFHGVIPCGKTIQIDAGLLAPWPPAEKITSATGPWAGLLASGYYATPACPLPTPTPSPSPTPCVPVYTYTGTFDVNSLSNSGNGYYTTDDGSTWLTGLNLTTDGTPYHYSHAVDGSRLCLRWPTVAVSTLVAPTYEEIGCAYASCGDEASARWHGTVGFTCVKHNSCDRKN